MFDDESAVDEWFEIEGRSKSDALERACNALNTTLPYLEYKVIGGKGSKIRARKLEEPKAEAEPKKTEERTERPERQARPERSGRPRRQARPTRPEPMEHNEEEEDEENRGNAVEGSEIEAAEKEAPEELLDEPSEVGIQAKEALCGILKHIDESAEAQISETTEEVRLEIIGNGSGLFIGKRGATLEALQHLVAKMMGLDRRSGKRISVDSEQYRKRRQEALFSMARKLAGRARREKRPISVEPMSAIDRRLLHLALKGDRNVATKSVGEGSGRKVVIVPKGYRGEVNERTGEREGEQGGRRSPKGPRGRSRSDGNTARRTSGNRKTQGAKPKRERPIPPGRMHDSFDVPSVPDDVFENDEDLMAFEETTDAERTTPPEAQAEVQAEAQPEAQEEER